MIIKNEVQRKHKNVWANALFHPTDAIEDPWGKRIIDKLSDDGAIGTIRIYAMFEDIVYLGENGEILYDFRLSDLRLDYLVEKGFDLLIAYAGMPDCIAASCANKTSVSKNATRYKGKMWNSAPPRDYDEWEEICYTYTKHLAERYGTNILERWHLQCFNEPDIPAFFMSELSLDDCRPRVEAYNKMYEGFERAVRRVSERIPIGGPALAFKADFFKNFLLNVKKKGLKLDFISLHNYGMGYNQLCKSNPICVEYNIEKQRRYFELISECGFGETPIVIDEWGMTSGGFKNCEDNTELICRETEVFSSYYARLIHDLVHGGFKTEMLMICLSGQHEMTEDFSGFRNFFTLNFIKKPIYNAHILASRLGEVILEKENVPENVYVTATKKEKNGYAVLLTYAEKNHRDSIPAIGETLDFEEDISGRRVVVYCIDKHNTNPYTCFVERGFSVTPSSDEILEMRREGELKPKVDKVLEKGEKITLELTANSTYLVEVF